MKSNTAGNITLNPTIQARIVNEIKAAGMSQKEMAQKIPIHPKYLSAILNGKKSVNISLIDRIGEELELRTKYLLCEDDYRTESELMAATGLNLSEDYKTMIAFLESIGIDVEIVKPSIIDGMEEKVEESQFKEDGIPVPLDVVTTKDKHSGFFERFMKEYFKEYAESLNAIEPNFMERYSELMNAYIESSEKALYQRTSMFMFHDTKGKYSYRVTPDTASAIFNELKKNTYSFMLSLLSVWTCETK